MQYYNYPFRVLNIQLSGLLYNSKGYDCVGRCQRFFANDMFFTSCPDRYHCGIWNCVHPMHLQRWRSQFNTYLICYCCIVWLDYTLIRWEHCSHQMTLLFLEWKFFVLPCLSEQLSFVSSSINTTFWMECCPDLKKPCIYHKW